MRCPLEVFFLALYLVGVTIPIGAAMVLYQEQNRRLTRIALLMLPLGGFGVVLVLAWQGARGLAKVVRFAFGDQIPKAIAKEMPDAHRW